MQMKSMFSLGLGEQNSWRLSSSPRGRRPCTTSTSTTILNTGTLISLRCRQPVGHRRPWTNHIISGRQGWTPWEDSGRHLERLLRGDCSLFLKMWKQFSFVFRALRPALGLKHANTVKFLAGKVHSWIAAFFFLLHLIFHLNPGFVGHWSSVGSHLLCLLQLWQLVQL